MDQSENKIGDKSLDSFIPGSLSSYGGTILERLSRIRSHRVPILPRSNGCYSNSTTGIRGTSERERGVQPTLNPPERVERMENKPTMVSRRDHTRDSLRRVKRIYHPSGRFLTLAGKRFDYIFEEFTRDPSLPLVLIPSLDEIIYYMKIDFISRRNSDERTCLTPVVFRYTPVRALASYDKKMLQECCNAWNRED